MPLIDLPLIDPNRYLSMWGSTASNIHDPIIDLSSLAIVETREIGLRSDSMLRGG